ncbi:NACHT, LRR and PYD domains-containing protein 12-like isoform X2 [Clupea harengus]|uniref:NACHT, LRR and PYD domains-containing protein 12-like isoform X2 n=1 Tax=Clupea harengus TaxID=7950 RepID=A0A6P8F6Z6_CLUHA|nr:NACHT, LRR and PYD domains-containing protein 12-like isoform X2 [Clupea harengus]
MAVSSQKPNLVSTDMEDTIEVDDMKHSTGEDQENKMIPDRMCKTLSSIPQLMRSALDDLSKAELKRFKTILKERSAIPWGKLEEADTDEIVEQMVQKHCVADSPKVMLTILRKMDKNQLATDLQKKLGTECDAAHTVLSQKESLKQKLRAHLKSRFSTVHQECKDCRVQDIYTQLYIVEGRTGGVICDHEVSTIDMRQIGAGPSSEDEQVKLANMFTDRSATKVLTLGIAGVGKTIAVQKFAMDWAEEKTNLDIDFVFLLLFRELNVKKKKCYSLFDLLFEFYTDLKDLKNFPEFSGCKSLFVLDGFDESKLRLDFEECISEPEEKSSVDILITSLIKGMLLPFAFIWVTTRPAAGSLIPRKCFNLVTEVRGFNDLQIIEFFQKNIKNPEQAKRVIDHINKNRSLLIMCHIPVFCYIIANLKDKILEDQSKEAKTLTEMYTLYCVSQIKRMNDSYPEDKKMSGKEKGQFLVKLGKLAFKHLEKGTLVFYEKDLKECSIGVDCGALQAGVCTQIFNMESAATGEKIFSFVHLSVQEFLAALYVVHEGVHQANPFEMNWIEKTSWLFTHSRFDLYIFAVEKALQSQNGHLDLFVRFLLGLAPMLEPKIRSPLDVLLPQLAVRGVSIKKTVQYIKEKIREDISPERIINLFHCLNELGDNSLIEEINRYLNSADEEKNLTPAQCSALAYLLLMSTKDMNEFDLKKYLRSERGLHRMLPVVKVSRRVWLNQCRLSKASCKMMASLLQGTPSHLRELDMSNNDLKDEGVELLCVGLRYPQCKLETVWLSHCLITHKGCSFLASALKSNPSYLKQLDLSYNHPGDSGVRELSERLHDPNCKLETFRMKPGLRKYACELTLDPNTAHRELSLSEGNRTVTRVRKKQPYPDHPERFDYWPQVLCREGLSGRCYWEVEWSGRVVIGVAYKSIQRKGRSEDRFGETDKSWCLDMSGNSGYSWYSTSTMSDKYTPLPAPLSGCSRVGVYLDWPAGTLSFYSVSSDRLTLLDTFRPKFTEPVYPVFWVDSGSSVSLFQIT